MVHKEHWIIWSPRRSLITGWGGSILGTGTAHIPSEVRQSQDGAKTPEATTRSPSDDKVDAAMNALHRRVRTAENRGVQVGFALTDSRSVWNPIKSPL